MNMAIDNLPGSAVRIRRERRGGRTGKVVVSDGRTGSHSSYGVIKVQLDAGGKSMDINSHGELEMLPVLAGGQLV
jgi:hypothetical protein